MVCGRSAMANPQAENGHIDIANDIAEALMKINLSAYESRVLWFLFRKTYGWKKKTDKISLSQFSSCIGLDRRLIHRAIKSLSSKKMIVIHKDDAFDVSYGFQKDYEKWKVSSKKMTVIKSDDEVSSKEMIRVSSKEIPTKDTITKDTIQKKREIKKVSFILPDWIDAETWDAYVAMRKEIKKPLTEKAKELAVAKLERLKKSGNNPTEVLNQSIFNSYQGLFEIKQQPLTGGNTNNGRTYANKQYGRSAEIPDATTAALAKLEEEYEQSITASRSHTGREAEPNDVPDFESYPSRS